MLQILVNKKRNFSYSIFFWHNFNALISSIKHKKKFFLETKFSFFFHIFPHGLGQHLLSLFLLYLCLPPISLYVQYSIFCISSYIWCWCWWWWFALWLLKKIRETKRNGRNEKTNVKCLNLRNTFHLKWKNYVLFYRRLIYFYDEFCRWKCFVL